MATNPTTNTTIDEKKKNMTVVTWWAQATANAIGSTTSIPSTTTSNSTTPGTISFGSTASTQQAKDSSYLDTRNTTLSNQYKTQGLKSKEEVLAELNKNADFASASDTDKMNTANEIFTKMGNTTTQQQVQQVQPVDATLTDAEKANPRLNTLSDVEKQAYSLMSDAEKKQFIDIGRNDLKNIWTYVSRWKEQRDFVTNTNNIQTDIRNKQGQINEIQSSARIRQAGMQLDNIKKNIAYLWTMGAPWVSAQKMDALSKQQAEAERVYNEIIKVEQLQKEMFNQGSTLTAIQMERQLIELQNDLDDKVSKSIQTALAGLSAADIKGQLDTVEEIDAFRKTLVTNLDNEISWITDDNIRARQFLIDRFDKWSSEQRETADEFRTNATKVNVDMSNAQWYYVDWNGQPIISAATGQVIPMPKKPPLDPIYDKDSGKLITFSSDDSGNIVSSVQQVSKPSWKIQTIEYTDEYGNTVKQSVMVNPDGSFSPINFSNSNASSEPNVQSQWFSWSAVSPIITQNPANIEQIASKMEEWVAYDCGDRGQCGEWFNDATGKQAPMWDSWDSKKKFIDPGITVWQVWMGVVFNPGGEYKDYGHVWILASWLYERNGVMWYDVVSANYDGNEKLSKDFIPEWAIAKNWWFVPLKTTNATNSTQNTSPQENTNKKENVQSIYQILTESGQSDSVAKKNAVTLAKSGKSIEDIKSEYPSVADQQTIKEYITNVSTAAENFDKSNNKLTALLSVLSKEDITGKDVEVALKSFVSAIDNTAAMAWEVEQAKSAGISAIDSIANKMQKLADWNVSDKTKKDILNTVQNFADWIRNAFTTYIDTKQNVLTKQYGKKQGDKLNIYKTQDWNSKGDTNSKAIDWWLKAKWKVR